MEIDIDKYAVIVAGGEGTRLGGDLPKQFRELQGRPVLWWSLKAFYDEDPDVKIIVVLHPGYFDVWGRLFAALPEKDRIPHEVVPGGDSRTVSVKNGIASIPDSRNAFIAIHDAARPLVSVDLIKRGWVAGFLSCGAVPALPVTDSLRILSEPGIEFRGYGSRAVDRSQYVVAQTPQIFRSDLLKEAYAKLPEAVFSDDATAFEAAGRIIGLYEGSPINIKVTNPGDLEIAEILLRNK